MIKWEYLVVDLSGVANDDQALLNSLGLKGWELVAVTEQATEANEYSQSDYYERTAAYFKRRAQDGDKTINNSRLESDIVDSNDEDEDGEE